MQHVWRLYSVLRSWGHARRSGHFDATWQQLAAACGYGDDVKALRSLQRYAALLDELGLARVYGVRDRRGAWQRLDVELRRPSDVEHDPSGYVAKRLTRRQRAVLGPLRAGRASRRLVPRVFRTSNLRTPKGRGLIFDQTPSNLLRCLGAPTRPCGCRETVTRSSAGQGAHGGGCAAGGCAGAAAPGGSTAVTGRGPAPPLRVAFVRTMARASLDPVAGDPTGRAALLSAAVAAAEQGVDGAAIVEAVWWTLHGAEGSRLVERRRQLVVGLGLLDRYAGRGAGRRGAGVQLVVERLLSDRFDVEREPGDVSLFSLGGVAAWAYSTGRGWRRAARGANRGRAPRASLGRVPFRRERGAWPWPDW